MLSLDKTSPVATYSASYSKTNGCPITIQTDNLSCRNCLYGSSKEQQGKEDFCDSTANSKGVSILPEQVWLVSLIAPAHCMTCHAEYPLPKWLLERASGKVNLRDSSDTAFFERRCPLKCR